MFSIKSPVKIFQFKPNRRFLAHSFEEIYQNEGKWSEVQVDAVLRDCLVFSITSKRIELQTWDWSSFEDIYEKSMKNCNAEL